MKACAACKNIDSVEKSCLHSGKKN